MVSTPKSRSTTCFLYLLSPREFIRIAGSLPFLPHLLMVRGDTRKIVATSRMVSRSGRLSSDSFGAVLLETDIDRIIKIRMEKVNIIYLGIRP